MRNQLETDYDEALEKAEEIGAQLMVHGATSTREVALSYQNLQNSRLWAKKDAEEKEYKEQRQREHS